METSSITTKEEREKIFSLFLKEHKLKFSDIEKALKIRSNHLNYHLQKLIEDNVLEKEEEFYKLTKDAEKLIPFYAHITSKEQGPLSIITAAILNNSKICLLKRKKRPYQGYWGLIGGKLKLHESISETALREAQEETGLKCKFEKISAVLHERVKEKDEIKHAFLIYLCKLSAKSHELKESDEGEIAWFPLSELPENIIPSDKLMVSLLESDFCMKEVIMTEKDNSLVKMEVK